MRQRSLRRSEFPLDRDGGAEADAAALTKQERCRQNEAAAEREDRDGVHGQTQFGGPGINSFGFIECYS
jgi:hypothetical protein